MFSVPAVRREVISTAEETVPDMYTRTGLTGIGKTGSLSSVMAFDRIEACLHAVVAACCNSFSTMSLNSAASLVLPAVKYTDFRPAVGASNDPGFSSSAVLLVDFLDRLCQLLPISAVRAFARPLSCKIDYFFYLVYLWSGPVQSGLVRSGLVWFGLIQSGPVRSGLFGLVRSGPVRSGPVWSGLVWSGPVRSGLSVLVRSGPVRSGPVWSGLVWSVPVRSGLVWSCLVRSGPVRSGPVWSVLVWSSRRQWRLRRRRVRSSAKVDVDDDARCGRRNEDTQPLPCALAQLLPCALARPLLCSLLRPQTRDLARPLSCALAQPLSSAIARPLSCALARPLSCSLS